MPSLFYPIDSGINQGSQKRSGLVQGFLDLGSQSQSSNWSDWLQGAIPLNSASAFLSVKGREATQKGLPVQAPWQDVHFSNRFPGFQHWLVRRGPCTAGALSPGKVTLQLGRPRVSAPDVAVTLKMSASLIVQGGLSVLVAGLGDERESTFGSHSPSSPQFHPCMPPPWMCRGEKAQYGLR